MPRSKDSDLRGVLDVLYELGSLPSSAPFPSTVLDRLGALVGADDTSYGEFSLSSDGHTYSTDHSVDGRDKPDWVSANIRRLWQVMRAAQYCTGIGNRKVHRSRRR